MGSLTPPHPASSPLCPLGETRAFRRPPIGDSRSPARYSRSPARYSRAPARYSRSPARYSRSPARYSRSPARYSRSPARYSRSPARYSRSPARYSLSPAPHSRPTAHPSRPTANHSRPTANHFPPFPRDCRLSREQNEPPPPLRGGGQGGGSPSSALKQLLQAGQRSQDPPPLASPPASRWGGVKARSPNRRKSTISRAGETVGVRGPHALVGHQAPRAVGCERSRHLRTASAIGWWAANPRRQRRPVITWSPSRSGTFELLGEGSVGDAADMQALRPEVTSNT